MKELYSENQKDVISCFGELRNESEKVVNALAPTWDRCVQYSNDNQLIENGAGIAYQQNGIARNGRPVQGTQLFIENEIAPIVRVLSSFYTRSKPTLTAVSRSRDREMITNAELSELLIQAKYELDKETKVARRSIHWAMGLGTIFRKDYWDSSAGSCYRLPEYDELGNEVIGENGEVNTTYQPVGSNRVAILTPLSIDTDYSELDFEDVGWVCENYLADIDWVKQNFNKNEKGYNPEIFNSNKIKVESGNLGNLRWLEQMKYYGPNQASTYGNKGAFYKNKVKVSELYVRPNGDYREGRMLVIIDDTHIVYDSAKVGNPYYFPYEDTVWHPYNMYRYEEWIGRMLGKGLIEQLLTDQTRLNEINGIIVKNGGTMAQPWILTPENCLVKGTLAGGGARIVTFKEKPSGSKPEIVFGTPLPEQFFRERQNLIDHMVRKAGSNLLLTGNVPPGVTAAAALQLMLENSSNQLGDNAVAWEDFNQRVQTLKLRLFRKFNNQPDYHLLDYMRTLAPDYLDYQIDNFTGQDIGDGITIKIEKGSMIPKSYFVIRDQYRQFAEMGLLGNLADPSPRGEKMRSELLERFGEKPLTNENNVEIEKAEWENDKMMLGQMMPINEFDLDDIHLACHKEQFQSPKFQERATPISKQIFYQHIKLHEESQAKKAQQAQEQQKQQMLEVAQAENQMKISQEQAKSEGDAKVEEIKGLNKMKEQQVKNSGIIAKEKVQADLANSFFI